jgi:hypothetical protein
MSSFEASAARPWVWAAPLARAVLPLFALTTFLSALLLFAIEPMFTKMALPLLGGSPSVWSVAMVFFQVLMLAGYSYAHALTRWLPARVGAAIHIGVLAIAFASLPIALRLADAPPLTADPTLWLILVFAASIGLPFFALSAHGPLLQSWFASARHAKSRDPYFLYAASNTGSFVALVAYPFAIEPFLGLSTQSAIVTILFAALATLLALAATAGLLGGAGAGRFACATPAATEPDAQPIGAGMMFAWIARSFVPAGLLVSVTAHISTDVAAAPLLWVIPLGLYLLTFVLTFRPRCLAGDARLSMLAAWSGLLALMMLGLRPGLAAVGLGVHLAAFFCAALMCHRALYSARPQPRALTLFYFSMSLGGALGGLFAGLIAPMIFSSIAEYPLLLVAALACRPGAWAAVRSTPPRAGLGLLAAIVAILLAGHALLASTGSTDFALKVAFGGLGALALLVWRNGAAAAAVGLAMAMQLTALPSLDTAAESYRSFFGVNRVMEVRGGQFRVLVHGTTVHGAIRIRMPDGAPSLGAPKPATYYLPDGPLGDAIAAARATHGTLRHIAVVGLGAGALACHARAGEPITFYEIDPIVARLASDPSRFRYLADCAPQAKLVIGDARLTLAAQTETSDVIVIDAFSSDAIPVHLLTREAIALYLSKLDDHGLLAMHISNDRMEFSGLIARAAADLGLVAYIRRDTNVSPGDPDMRMASAAVILARRQADLGPLRDRSDWRKIEPDPGMRVWTDDYSSILTAIIAKAKL